MVVYSTLCHCHGCNLPRYVNKKNLLCSACDKKRSDSLITEASSAKKEAELSLTDDNVKEKQW
jgi:hypothetical protein